MTIWTGLLLAASVPAALIMLLWIVPLLAVLEGEFGRERPRGSVSVGLLLGFLGLRWSLGGDGVETRLWLFRRPGRRFGGHGAVPRPDDSRKTTAESRGEGRPTTPRPAPPDGEGIAGSKPEILPAAPREGTTTTPEPAAPDGMARLRMVWAYIRRYRAPAIRFLRRVRKAFRIHRTACDLTFGTGDPATTGQLAGFLYAARPMLGPRARIDITPDFLATRFEGRVALTVRISLARITCALAGLVLTVAASLGWETIRKRWRRIRGGRVEGTHVG